MTKKTTKWAVPKTINELRKALPGWFITTCRCEVTLHNVEKAWTATIFMGSLTPNHCRRRIAIAYATAKAYEETRP